MMVRISCLSLFSLGKVTSKQFGQLINHKEEEEKKTKRERERERERKRNNKTRRPELYLEQIW